MQSVVVNSGNLGLVGSWRNAWTWKPDELFLILEDDGEVSPHWYRVIVNTWLVYGEREDLAAISLQKQTVNLGNTDQPFNVNIDFSSLVSTPVFLYELSGIGGANGLSPHPHHWSQFISLYGDRMRSCPPGMTCYQEEIWEPWWHHYVSSNRLFTLYLSHSLAMVSNHRDKGVHQDTAVKNNKDADFIHTWETCWEKDNLPKHIPRYNLNIELVSDIMQEAFKIKDKHGIVILTILDEKEPYEDLSTMERDDLLDKTLFITIRSDHKHHHLPHLVVDLSVDTNLTQQYLLKTISTLTRHQVPLLTLPPGWPGPVESILRLSGSVRAGKIPGQHSPQISFMFFDGAVEQVYRFIERWSNLVRVKGKFIEFKEAWIEDVRKNNILTWDWIHN